MSSSSRSSSSRRPRTPGGFRPPKRGSHFFLPSGYHMHGLERPGTVGFGVPGGTAGGDETLPPIHGVRESSHTVRPSTTSYDHSMSATLGRPVSAAAGLTMVASTGPLHPLSQGELSHARMLKHSHGARSGWEEGKGGGLSRAESVEREAELTRSLLTAAEELQATSERLAHQGQWGSVFHDLLGDKKPKGGGKKKDESHLATHRVRAELRKRKTEENDAAGEIGMVKLDEFGLEPVHIAALIATEKDVEEVGWNLPALKVMQDPKRPPSRTSSGLGSEGRYGYKLDSRLSRVIRTPAELLVAARLRRSKEEHPDPVRFRDVSRYSSALLQEKMLSRGGSSGGSSWVDHVERNTKAVRRRPKTAKERAHQAETKARQLDERISRVQQRRAEHLDAFVHKAVFDSERTLRIEARARHDRRIMRLLLVVAVVNGAVGVRNWIRVERARRLQRARERRATESIAHWWRGRLQALRQWRMSQAAKKLQWYLGMYALRWRRRRNDRAARILRSFLRCSLGVSSQRRFLIHFHELVEAVRRVSNRWQGQIIMIRAQRKVLDRAFQSAEDDVIKDLEREWSRKNPSIPGEAPPTTPTFARVPSEVRQHAIRDDLTYRRWEHLDVRRHWVHRMELLEGYYEQVRREQILAQRLNHRGPMATFHLDESVFDTPPPEPRFRAIPSREDLIDFVITVRKDAKASLPHYLWDLEGDE